MTRHAIAHMSTLNLGSVVDNEDPDGRGRVKVRLHALDVEVWASVTVASAGSGYGVVKLPRVDEVVVIGFITPELPLVLGSVWVGGDALPEDGAPVESRYLSRTPAGTMILQDDESDPRVEITTPGGQRVTVTDADGGAVEVDVQGTTVKVTSDKVEIQASGNVEVQAGKAKISAGMLDVDAGMAKFSGVVKCSTLIADSVVGTSYTPGAGNIW